MHRIDTPTADPNANGTGKAGFRDGVPPGTAATDLNDDWFNALQEEMAALVEGTGTPLVKAQKNQAAQILLRMLARPLMDIDLMFSGVGTARAFNDVCFGPGAGPLDIGLHVAVGFDNGNTTRMVSVDGKTWITPVTQFSTDSFWSCAHGGSGSPGSRVFVIAGAGATNIAKVWTAPDDAPAYALTLTDRSGNLPAIPGATSVIKGVAWNGTTWCMVGESGTILTTGGDASGAWTLRSPASSYVGHFRRVIATAATTLIAIGATGQIQRSTNHGAGWSTVYANSPVVGDLTSIVEVAPGYLLVATSTSNTVLRSIDDGATWTAVTAIPVNPIAQFDTGATECLLTLGGVAAAILKDASEEKRVIVASLDRGLTWPLISRPETSAFRANGAVSNGERAIFVGSDSGLTTYYAARSHLGV